ncbi:MAG: Ig-like domain-containing protein [Gemmatimonadaceae bacterium]
MRYSFLRYLLVVLAVEFSIAACIDRSDPTDPSARAAPAIQSVSVTIPKSTLEVGMVVDALATSLNSSGEPVPGAKINWLSSDNSILTVNADGVVGARKMGTAWLYATNDRVAGKLSVTVTDSVPAAVHVSPRSAQIPAGASTQLTVTIATSTGRAVPAHTIAWTTGDAHLATVSATGLVTAMNVGAVRIIASASSAADTSVITISSVVVPPPVVPVGTTHEPSIMSVLQDWDGHSFGAWTTTDQRSTAQFVFDPSLQNTVMQMQYGPVVVAAHSTYGVGHFYFPLHAAAPLHSVYLRAQIKLSAGWVQNPSAVLKLFEVFSGRTWAIPGIYGRGSNLRLMVANDEPGDRNYPGCFIGQQAPGCKAVTAPPDNFTLDTWHTIEVLLVSNTAGLNNGRVKTWLDGKPQTDVSDVMWSPNATDNSFRQFDLNPLWGGLGGTISAPQWLSVGKIHFSGTSQYISGRVP